jgi:hypothetical protein
MSKPITTAWLLLLQDFNITIIDQPEKNIQVEYFHSHLNNPDESVLVENSFEDENLFAISIKSPWFVDVANYLTTEVLPTYFSP